jgi:hypothetical protein
MAKLYSLQRGASILAEEQAYAAKLSEGDTITMQGEVTIVHDDGTVTARLHGYDVPVTTRGEHLSLVAKKKSVPGRNKLLYDKPD